MYADIILCGDRDRDQIVSFGRHRDEDGEPFADMEFSVTISCKDRIITDRFLLCSHKNFAAYHRKRMNY